MSATPSIFRLMGIYMMHFGRGTLRSIFKEAGRRKSRRHLSATAGADAAARRPTFFKSGPAISRRHEVAEFYFDVRDDAYFLYLAALSRSR